MAKYTEQLYEYLEDHDLPQVFSTITGFADAFIRRYCDYEIGFETENLFETKLEGVANLVIPEYARRIQYLNARWAQVGDPRKTRHTIDNTDITLGEQNGSITDLPINATTAEPNSLTHADEYTNSNDRDVTEEESGATIDETIKMMEFLESKRRNVIEECLDEFKTLFMRVF